MFFYLSQFYKGFLAIAAGTIVLIFIVWWEPYFHRRKIESDYAVLGFILLFFSQIQL